MFFILQTNFHATNLLLKALYINKFLKIDIMKISRFAVLQRYPVGELAGYVLREERGEALAKIQNYKLRLTTKVLSVLTYEQKENLYDNNIFMQVRSFKKDGKEHKHGITVTYNMYGESFTNRVKKVINELVEYADPVTCLPTLLKPKKYAVSSWLYGDSYSSASNQVKVLCPEKYDKINKKPVMIARYYNTDEFAAFA